MLTVVCRLERFEKSRKGGRSDQYDRKKVF